VTATSLGSITMKANYGGDPNNTASSGTRTIGIRH
jgi:hypothetical protein